MIESWKKDYGPSEGPGIILVNPKYVHNVAAAIRAASCFDVTRLVWTGSRVDPSTLERLPREERMKGYKDVLWTHDTKDKPFNLFTQDVVPVCIELLENSEGLTHFVHPENAVYVFGREDGGVPQVLRRFCHRFVNIPANHCLNLATAIAITLYDRKMKRQLKGLEPVLSSTEMLKEHRGPMEIAGMPGWDGH
jgi:tRNA(Leu) C34 or U34 (ribose-2'-O)-methylase TrmL